MLLWDTVQLGLAMRNNGEPSFRPRRGTPAHAHLAQLNDGEDSFNMKGLLKKFLPNDKFGGANQDTHGCVPGEKSKPRIRGLRMKSAHASNASGPDSQCRLRSEFAA
jgi:hypothetical protein